MSNITVRAAAEGMPAINRRRLLNLTGAGLALAATAASVRNASATPPVAAAAEHPDAELFALEKEMEAAHARMETAAEANSTLSDKIEALLPPRPPKWEDPDMPDHLHEINLDRRLRDMGEIPEPIRAWFKERREQKAANEALHDAYHAKIAEIHREGGVDAAEEAFNACVSEVDEFTKRICSIPAHTFEGMVVKLRAHVRSGGEIEKEEMYLDDYAFASIAADIRRLATGGDA
ncbi:MAG: hypothetical protein E5X67_36215 [Mesorhizobium sp.]|uniref:hypothetical protein n=1 Tax=Mesorhizobium sp. TaxID=1871066 RepID=UPI0011FDFEF7|nr:hypothetical protein [Mesorhizobium sp.]TIP22709.1 MAG: hypothetical protein E5X67_36215 [Mesorhizobium sp.]